AIGFLSWVGLAYSLKFLWAPFIDRLDAPGVGRLGRRRGWTIISQLLVASGLIGLSAFGLKAGLTTVGLLALVVAFSSSTQDIVVDAWRIEVASDADELGLLSAAYQLGYRFAIIVNEALILILANHFGWPLSYAAMAALMAVGAGATLLASEPLRAEKVLQSKTATAPLVRSRGCGARHRRRRIHRATLRVLRHAHRRRDYPEHRDRQLRHAGLFRTRHPRLRGGDVRGRLRDRLRGRRAGDLHVEPDQ